MTTQNKTAVVAVGGNALILDKAHEDVNSQMSAVEETCKHIAAMIMLGWNVVVTHGNGPQVGFILRRNELAYPEVHSTPLDVIGADTQGAIGYMIARALDNEFKKHGIHRNVAAVVTQVLVDRNDPGFKNPTKGIGGFTTQDKAEIFKKEGWIVKEDAGRGWRRMVPSPFPKKILEIETIRTLVKAGVVTITTGGGGIPVIDEGDGQYTGVEGAVDKDYAASLLAQELKADLFVVSTAVEKVAINFNTSDQVWYDKMTLSQAKQFLADGVHFAKGSMAPKVHAIIWYLENGGKEAVITNPENIGRALKGETGTWFFHD